MRLLYDRYETFDQAAIRRSIAERFDFGLAGQKLKAVYEAALQTAPQASAPHKSGQA